jgi:hypothetical protein
LIDSKWDVARVLIELNSDIFLTTTVSICSQHAMRIIFQVHACSNNNKMRTFMPSDRKYGSPFSVAK